MATITLRVDDETRDRVEVVARARGANVSELLRSMIDDLLNRDSDGPREDSPTTLTMVERRLLAMQHEILACVGDPVERDEHEERVVVLNHGYTAEYGDEFVALRPELSRRDCALVWDILDMFSVLKGSMAHAGYQAADLGENGPWALMFRGFDGNDPRESRLRGYVKFLLDTGRWEELADDFNASDRGNSHMRTLPTYLRMLAVFEPILQGKVSRGLGLDGYRLNSEEIQAVLAAWPYPSQGQ